MHTNLERSTRQWPGRITRAQEVDRHDNADLVDGSVRQEFLDALQRAVDLVQRADVPASPMARAEGYRHLLALAHLGIMEAFAAPDPLAPIFERRRHDAFKWGLDCPDALYRRAPISGDLTYRVAGNLGTARYVSFRANEGISNHGKLRGDELVTAADGSFELLAGPGTRGDNHLRTLPDADLVTVRQFFDDWDAERPATLHIEQVDGVTPTTDLNAATPERTARLLRTLGPFI